MGLKLLKLLFASTILANGYSNYLADDLSDQGAEEPIALSMRNAMKDPKTRWPGGVVPIELTGNFDQNEVSMIRLAINHIEKDTCVRLPLSGRQPNNLYLSIKKLQTGNCFTDGVGLPPPHLRPARMTLAADGCISMTVVLHELLHVLGLAHMHQNYNRDQHLDVHFENIRSDRIDQFNMWPPGVLTDFGLPYDYDSRTHYDNYAFNNNGQPTMTAKKNANRILSGVALSPLDIKKINNMYCT